MKRELKWWQKSPVYEVYVRSFKDSDGDGTGDLNGITSKLDYLQSLGIGALWLTPCYVSPQADNGYDIEDYYNIDPMYGTMDDMENLIAEAGKRNIRIVMDLVFNHTSDRHPWFLESKSSRDNDRNDWYIWRNAKADGSPPTNWRSIFGGPAWEYCRERNQYYLHTFLKEQPDLNWENPAVRKALIDAARFWVSKGIGGFRMDAAAYIKKPEFTDGVPDASDGMTAIHAATANTEGILDFLKEFRDAAVRGTDIFTVGEANGVSASELHRWVGDDGAFDMLFEFSHVLIDLPDEADWCRTESWTLPGLKKLFSDSQKNTAGNGWYPVFLENHDQPRSVNHFLPENADRISGAKALGTLLMTMRGSPFVMQGEELGYVNVRWPSADDYNDVSTKNHYAFALSEGYTEEEALAGIHRFSRDSSRTPMQWDDSRHAGFTEGTPWLCVNDDFRKYNVRTENADPESVLNWYRKLAELRRKHSELTDGDYTEVLHEHSQIFAYRRKNDRAEAVILINMSCDPAYYDAGLCSAGVQIAGTHGKSRKGFLRPLEAVIYEEVKL